MPKIPRWVKFLRIKGVVRLPPMPSRDPDGTYATNLLCQLVHQAQPRGERNTSQEHMLRNLTRAQPYKP